MTYVDQDYTQHLARVLRETREALEPRGDCDFDVSEWYLARAIFYAKRAGLSGPAFEQMVQVAWPSIRTRKKQPIPRRLRELVLERDDYTCQGCGDSPMSRRDLHADHVFPESLGGPTTINNLQALCRHCNLAKGAKVGWPECA